MPTKQLGKVAASDFSLGMGAELHTPGAYGVAICIDARSGKAMNGLNLRADYSGIDAGYKIITNGHFIHNVTDWVVATNGTNTKVYRFESTAWVVKDTQNSALATNGISFTDTSGNATVAVFYGSAKAFRYSVNDGTAWTDSTKTVSSGGANAMYGNYAVVQRVNQTSPKVAYVVNPNQLFYTTSLVNGVGSTTTVTFIDDANTSASYFTSITEYVDGTLMIGKRYELFSVDSAGAVISKAGPYPDTVTDAGGTLDLRNFAVFIHLNGRLYYVVQGYDILEYDHGSIDLIAPYRRPGRIIDYPRVRRPVTGLTAIDGELFVAVSSSQTGRFTTAWTLGPIIGPAGLYSQLYSGQCNGGNWIWHGSLIAETFYCRGLWYDPPHRLLFMADEAGGHYRSFVPPSGAVDQLSDIASAGVYVGEYGTAGTLWLGSIDTEDGSQSFGVGRIRMTTTGLGGLSATSPSITVNVKAYKGNSGDATGYSTKAFAVDAEASYGVMLPGGFGGSRLRVAYVFASSAVTKPAVLWDSSIEVKEFAASRRPVGIL